MKVLRAFLTFIWRGSATAVIDPDLTLQERGERINEAV